VHKPSGKTIVTGLDGWSVYNMDMSQPHCVLHHYYKGYSANPSASVQAGVVCEARIAVNERSAHSEQMVVASTTAGDSVVQLFKL
jgi:hypothetical protein